MAKKWIQGAVNPKHKGYCTPMTKSTCTPRRKALARTFKKHHGFHKSKKEEGGYVLPEFAQGGGLSRKKDYGSKKKPYPMVKSGDFAGGGRSYPIPTKADAVDALRLAGLHGRSDVKAKVYKKYPGLKKHPTGGKVGITKDRKVKEDIKPGTPLRDIVTIPSGASEYYKQVSAIAARDELNRLRWANFHGSMINYPEGQGVPQFQYTPGMISELKKRGLSKDYIESWQPGNYENRINPDEIPEFGLGGWLKENKEGIFGGLKALGGGALSLLTGGIFGRGLLSSGIGDVVNEIRDGNSADQQQSMNGIAVHPQGPTEIEKAMYNRSLSPGMTQVSNQYAPTFACGGKVKRKMPDGGKVDKKQLYDIERAKELGYTPDSTGHMPSRDYETGRILKSPAHPTFQKALDEDANLGYMPLVDIQGNVYTIHPEDIPSKGPFAPNKRKMPFGGTVDTETVELETGEPFRTPDGKIGVIKTEDALSHAKGGAVVPLEVGTQILGKKKDPDTKKTYKEMGKKLALQKKKYDKILEGTAGSYSKNAAKAMTAKLDNKFTSLFEKQEAGKTRKSNNDMYPFGGGVGVNLVNLLGQGVQNSLSGASLGGAGLGQASAMAQPGLFGKVGNFLGGLGQSQFGQKAGGFLNTAAQLSPVAYNLIQGSRPAEQLNAADFYNPQYSQSIDLMSNRRFDVNPLLEANRNAQAIGDYNAINQGGLSAGAIASNRLANTAQRMRADQSAYSQQQNYNNQYLGQEAGFRANLGAQRSQTNYQVAQDNLAAQAARRQMLGAGFTGLSDWAQNQQLMRNQAGTDQQRLDILQNMYPYYNKWFGGIGR